MKGRSRYGECLENGKGVPLDLNEAAECYQHSPMQNYSEAQYAYGRCYEKGEGIALN
jgi:TPR repeat protein